MNRKTYESMRIAAEDSGNTADIVRLTVPSDVPSDASSQLAKALANQGQQYENLLVLLESLNAEEDVHGSRSQAVLKSIQQQLTNLQTTGDSFSQLRERLSAGGLNAFPELQTELKQQEQLLERCLNRIRSVEGEFLDRRLRLQPLLEDSVRRRSMQAAYHRSMKTG